MTKDLYATIKVERKNEERELNIYKTKDQKYGIEVEVGENETIKKIDNITENEQRLDNFLDVLLNSMQKFELLEDCVDECSDVKKTIQWL